MFSILNTCLLNTQFLSSTCDRPRALHDLVRHFPPRELALIRAAGQPGEPRTCSRLLVGLINDVGFTSDLQVDL